MSTRRIEYMPLSALKPAERNPKAHGSEGIRASISQLGNVDAIIIDERTGRLVGGHGRLEVYETMVADGETPPDGIILDEQGEWNVPVQRGWESRSDRQAEEALLALNQHTMRGGWNDTELDAILKDLVDQGSDLFAAGFDENYNELLARSTIDSAAAFAQANEHGDADADADADTPAPFIMPGDQFARLAFTFSIHDRDYVAARMRLLRHHYGVPTSAAVLRRLVDEVSIDTKTDG